MSQWLDGPYSQAARVEYLQAKYKTIARLNAIWCQQYTSWEQLEDPRLTLPIGLKKVLEGLQIDHLDMMAFENHLRAWHMGWRCAALKEADPTHLVMAHVGGMVAR